VLIGGLFEVIVYVRDMHAQVRFYRDVLGQEISWPAGLADYSGEHWVAFASGGNTFALHSGGGEPAGTPPRYGFRSADIHAAREALLAAGVSLDAVRSPAPGVLVLDCKDPEGNGFFIEQRDQAQ
jgi:catechol 2,3-dioxygenase-like lactoylglutathione lyase family enzyme